jgi:glutamate synthase (ferredoxin)
VQRHATLTGSKLAERILENWEASVAKFVKVMPTDYKRVQDALKRVMATGLTGDEAAMAAFEENARDVARAAGA